MKKIGMITRTILILTVIGLLLTATGSYAAWHYLIDNPVESKTTTSQIDFLFPRPLGPLDFTGPRTSESLWGAGYKEDDIGKVINGNTITKDDIDKVTSTEQSQQNLLTSYTALNLQINSYAETKLLISFEVTFCLAPGLIETTTLPFTGTTIQPQFPFADEYSITRNGKEIGSGVIYCEDSGSEVERYKNSANNVRLDKGVKAFEYFIRDYYYYTATINAEVNGFDIKDFIVDPPEPGSEPNYASFILDVKHNTTQENTIASFASVKIIATEYPAPAESTASVGRMAFTHTVVEKM